MVGASQLNVRRTTFQFAICCVSSSDPIQKFEHGSHSHHDLNFSFNKNNKQFQIWCWFLGTCTQPIPDRTAVVKSRDSKTTRAARSNQKSSYHSWYVNITRYSQQLKHHIHRIFISFCWSSNWPHYLNVTICFAFFLCRWLPHQHLKRIKNNLALSVGLIMWIYHRKEIRISLRLLIKTINRELIKPKYILILPTSCSPPTQYHNFFRNLPLLE